MELGPKPPHLAEIPVTDLIDAKVHTAEFLASLGEEADLDSEIEAEAAHAAFVALTGPTSDEEKRNGVALLESPESVRRLVAMLTAYEWQYIEHAAQIRAKLVADLLHDTDDPDPRVRMKAIELLGKVKEVALFEERSVVRKENVSDEEINARLRALIEKAQARKTQQPVEDAIFTEKSA